MTHSQTPLLLKLSAVSKKYNRLYKEIIKQRIVVFNLAEIDTLMFKQLSLFSIVNCSLGKCSSKIVDKDLFSLLSKSATSIVETKCEVKHKKVKVLIDLSKANLFKEFVLNNKPVVYEGIKRISVLTSLTSLKLTSCKIKSKACRFLTLLPNLTHLNLFDNDIGREGCEYLSECPNLTVIDLTKNMFKSDEFDSLGGANKLQKITLGLDPFSDISFESVASIKVNTMELKEVDFKLNFSGIIGVMMCRKFIIHKCLLTNDTMNLVDIKMEELEVSETRISQVRFNSNKLKKLAFKKCNLEAEKIIGLGMCTELEEINLSGNKYVSLKTLRLDVLEQLRVIDMSDNLLKNDGLETLGEIKELSLLNLSANQLQGDCLEALESTEIEVLMITGNLMTQRELFYLKLLKNIKRVVY